jgi:hypothetical protein
MSEEGKRSGWKSLISWVVMGAMILILCGARTIFAADPLSKDMRAQHAHWLDTLSGLSQANTLELDEEDSI